MFVNFFIAQFEGMHVMLFFLYHLKWIAQYSQSSLNIGTLDITNSGKNSLVVRLGGSRVFG